MVFRLAPMSGLIRGMTCVLLLVPIGFMVWPLRRRHIPKVNLAGASEVGREDLRKEFGVLLRVGAGGLWGGFGLACSSRGEHLSLYVSRHADGFVLVRARGKRSLLITPERPAAFVAALAP